MFVKFWHGKDRKVVISHYVNLFIARGSCEDLFQLRTHQVVVVPASFFLVLVVSVVSAEVVTDGVVAAGVVATFVEAVVTGVVL